MKPFRLQQVSNAPVSVYDTPYEQIRHDNQFRTLKSIIVGCEKGKKLDTEFSDETLSCKALDALFTNQSFEV